MNCHLCHDTGKIHLTKEGDGREMDVYCECTDLGQHYLTCEMCGERYADHRYPHPPRGCRCPECVVVQ